MEFRAYCNCIVFNCVNSLCCYETAFLIECTDDNYATVCPTKWTLNFLWSWCLNLNCLPFLLPTYVKMYELTVLSALRFHWRPRQAFSAVANKSACVRACMCVHVSVFISNAFLQTNFISSLLAGYCGVSRNSDFELLLFYCLTACFIDFNTISSHQFAPFFCNFSLPSFIFVFLFNLNWSGFRHLVPSSLSEQKSLDVACQTLLVYQSPKALNTYFCRRCQRDLKITSSHAEVPYLITLMVTYCVIMLKFSWICSPYLVSDCTFWPQLQYFYAWTLFHKCGTSLMWKGWCRQYSLCAIFLKGWMHLWYRSSGLSCRAFIAFGFIRKMTNSNINR